jgi:Protein kinase domain
MEKSSLGRIVRGYIERAKGEARDIAVERRIDLRRCERAPMAKREPKPGDLSKIKNSGHLDIKSARYVKEDGIKTKTPSNMAAGTDISLNKLAKRSRVADQRLVLAAQPLHMPVSLIMQNSSARQRSRSPLLTVKQHPRSKGTLTSQPSLPAEMQRSSANVVKRDVSWIKTTPLFANESRSLSRTVRPSFNINKVCLPEISDFSKTQRSLQANRKYRTVQEVPEARELLVSSKIDDFEIIQPLGKGAYATTSLAVHKDTQIAVALKTYVYGDTNMLKSAVDSECDILASMSHTNIIQYYGRFDRLGQTILILE